jgi:hypothetical protein
VAAARFERHVLWLCGAGACVVLLCVSGTPALAQDEPGPRARTTKDVAAPAERLWKEYPLNPTSTAHSSTEPTRPELLRSSSTSARGGEDDGFPAALFTFVGIALGLLAVLALSAMSLSPRRRRVLPGGWRGVDVDMFVPQSLRARSDPMSKRPEQARSESGAPDEREGVVHEPVDANTAMDYTRVGEQVTALLTSAQQAADQMLASAREEAVRVRSGAQEEAAAEKAEALSEATRIQRESERLRLEVETYGKETRDAADAYAAETRAEVEPEVERRLAEADERAKVIVAEAEQRARYVAQEEVRRQEALASGAERYEERLKNLREVFRGMATELDDLIRTNQEAKDQEGSSEEAEQDAEAPAGEVLEDALRPEHQTHARSTQPSGR